MTSYVIIGVALLAAGAAIGWLRWRLRIITVVGESMRPTLAPGDRLLVRRTPLARVKTGDLVVIQVPKEYDPGPGPVELPGPEAAEFPTLDAAGLSAPDAAEFLAPDAAEAVHAEANAGDRWLIKRAVAVPGDPVPPSVAPALSIRAGSPVREGSLIAIGDNRDASFDSRAFGYVSAEDVLGVVIRPIHTG